MSPEGRRTVALLARLRRECEADRTALARRRTDAEETLDAWGEEVSRERLAFAAVTLHAWYTGLETLLERVARELDGDLPSGPRWHQDLLAQATAELIGVRPPVLPPELLGDLLALLAFRHFFRHAYAAELDPARVRPELERLVRVAPSIDRALDALDAFLLAAAEAAAE